MYRKKKWKGGVGVQISKCLKQIEGKIKSQSSKFWGSAPRPQSRSLNQHHRRPNRRSQDSQSPDPSKRSPYPTFQSSPEPQPFESGAQEPKDGVCLDHNLIQEINQERPPSYSKRGWGMFCSGNWAEELGVGFFCHSVTQDLVTSPFYQ